MHNYRSEIGNKMEPSSRIIKSDVTILMAYSDDYTIGRLCESVNREYASRYSHTFLSYVQSCEEILKLIKPKMHVTWYKIYLLRKIMIERMISQGYSEEDINSILYRAHKVYDRGSGPEDKTCDIGVTCTESLNGESFEKMEFKADNYSHHLVNDGYDESMSYLFWIDGDAIVSYHDFSIDELIREAQYRELIIAEDMHKHNPINAGVFLLRICPWSLEFLESTWINRRYDTTYYYEQSAMIKALRYRKQGFYHIRPFHSFDGGPQDVKIFPNVSVFPLALFSSNDLIGIDESEVIIAAYADASPYYESEKKSPDKHQEGPIVSERRRPLFVFHVAGMKSKLNLLKAAIIKYNLPCPLLGSSDWADMRFKLKRNNLGHVIVPYSGHLEASSDLGIVAGEDSEK